MSSVKTFNAISDFCYNVNFYLYENIGNIFNYSCIVLGFFGLFYWLRTQNKFDKEAENNPNQLR